MSKKIDWNAVKINHGDRAVPGQAKPKYRSAREFLQKGLKVEEEDRSIREFMAKAQPAMEALLKCRLEDKTPITVVRPFKYQTSELVHRYHQVEDRENGGWKNGEVQNSSFQDVVKSISPGTQLLLKGLDPNLQEFIFEDQRGS